MTLAARQSDEAHASRLAGFISRWVRIYKSSRLKNVYMVQTYGERMRREFGLGEPSDSHDTQLVEDGLGWLAGEGRLTFSRLARSFWREARTVAGFLRSNRRGCNLLVISDTRRLAIADTPAAFAAELRPVNRTANFERFAAAISENDALLLFSPNLTAGHASGTSVQIGYLGLASLLVIAPWASFSRILLFLAVSLATGKFARKHLFWGVIAALIDTLLAKAHIRRIVLLTSNSYAVELARWRALLRPSIEAVTEIQHGVPTLELIDYYEEMLTILPPDCKSRFELIPTVPAIELGFSSGVGLDFAINSKFQEFAATHDVAELTARLTASQPKDRYRVVINGGATNPLPYFASDMFRIEQAVISEVRGYSLLSDIDIEIVYTIHPSHLKSGLVAGFRSRLEVDQLWCESIDSWLTADLCVALVSSSIWEARYLGAATFIAVREADRIYPRAYLQGGHYVGDEQLVTEALRDALEKMSSAKPIAAKEVGRRIGRLYGSDDETVDQPVTQIGEMLGSIVKAGAN